MNLSPGTKLGPYEITGPLGAGGMGEVYRARDARLGRDVAIKSLPPDVAHDTERLARFEREAKLLASLSHPNIAGIHGLEESSGAMYLILEFVEGETLAQRIARGALPVDDAIHVCAQVAAAVEAAHEAGIIHRDLKPGNVMLKPDGTVKVLDFGLARADAAAGSDPSITTSPTVTHMATSAGVILGTAAYMSPEQARGKSVDRRTDIWSFGCVLYECLTGTQLFAGETVSDVIARILQTSPDWNALPAATPPRVRNLMERCLERDPKRRLRDIGEARIALDPSGAPSSEAAPTESTAEPTRRPRVMLTVALVVLTAILSVLATKLTTHAPAPPALALSVMLPRGEHLDGGTENNLLAIAPDGGSLVYAASGDGDHRLWLRRFDRPDAVAIPGTDGARNPFLSPDGEWIGFFSGTKLYKVSVRGGTPIALADIGLDRSGTWLDDGTIVYSPTSASPLFRIDAGGGTPHALTTIDTTKNERTHRWPCALPGAKWIVYTVGLIESPGGYDDSNIEAVSIETGERRVLAQGRCARYAPARNAPGRLIIARRGSLYAVPLDPLDPRGGATPLPVLDGVIGVSTSGISFFDIARNGTLALVPGVESTHEFSLEWIDVHGQVIPLDITKRSYQQFDISPDGTRALAEIGPGGGGDDVFLLDLQSGNLNQITFDGHSGSARWLPGGRAIVWSRTQATVGTQIVKRSLLGDEEPLVLTSSPGALIIDDVARDGSAVYFHEYGRVDADLLMVPTDGSGRVETIISEPRAQTHLAVSPDGRWMAYVSGESGGSLVCVRPLGRPGGRVQMSPDSGWRPAWSADGHELYYATGETMVATAVSVQGDAMLPGATRRLFDIPSSGTDSSERGFDLDPTRGRFLVRVPAGETSEMREISVRLNWAQSITP